MEIAYLSHEITTGELKGSNSDRSRGRRRSGRSGRSRRSRRSWRSRLRRLCVSSKNCCHMNKHAPCQAVGSDMTSRTPSCKHDGQSSVVHKMARCKVDSVDSWRGNGNGPSNYRRASPAARTSAQPCSCVPGHTPVSPDGTCCQSSCPFRPRSRARGS